MQEESRREKQLVELALSALGLKLAVAKTGTGQILLVMDADTSKAVGTVVSKNVGRRLEDRCGVFLSWLKKTRAWLKKTRVLDNGCLEKSESEDAWVEVLVENPFFGKEREEVEIELDLARPQLESGLAIG